jgi:hypothetical protein
MRLSEEKAVGEMCFFFGGGARGRKGRGGGGGGESHRSHASWPPRCHVRFMRSK